MRQISLATVSDREAIQALYQTMLYGPADWDENYPNMDTIDFDLKRDALFVMKDEAGAILAVISIDEDEDVDALTCWNDDLAPWAELARLCVRKDLHNQGIAKEMMRYVFDVLRAQGKKSVHILVKMGHVAALCAYQTLGFQTVGNCHLFEKDFVCMEIAL